MSYQGNAWWRARREKQGSHDRA